MKKVLLTTALLLAAVSLAGCSDDNPVVSDVPDPVALDTPRPAASDVTAASFRASWKSVEHATTYRYALDEGEEKTTAETAVLFEGLEAGRTYTLSVQALSDDPLYTSSEIARITVATLLPEALAAPVPEAGQCTETSITVIWTAVPNAEEYLCSIDGGEETSTAELRYTFAGLEAGTVHKVRIKAHTSSPRYLDSEAAELSLATAPESDPFIISAADVTTSSFTAIVDPKTHARTYYMNSMTQEEFARYATGDEVVASLRRKFDAAALLSGTTYNEYIASQLTSGRQERPFTRLKPGTGYVVYAVGWDAASDLLTTDFVTCDVTTEPEIAGSVDIAFENVAVDGFDVVCTPEAPVEKYYVYVVKTNSLTMEQLMAGGLEGFKTNVMPTKEMYSGVTTIVKNGLASGTRYSVCVLAVSAGGATTYKEVTCATEKP